MHRNKRLLSSLPWCALFLFLSDLVSIVLSVFTFSAYNFQFLLVFWTALIWRIFVFLSRLLYSFEFATKTMPMTDVEGEPHTRMVL